MENIGKVTDTKKYLCLREFVGDGTTPDGRKFELSTAMGDRSPLVIYKNKMYHLSWNDICNLAEAVGLFNDDKETKSEDKDNGSK